MGDSLNGLAIATILTSLFILRFRGWKRPWSVVAYFAFFLILETVVSRRYLPPGAMGSGVAMVCFGLSVPLLAAAFFVWRHEKAHGEIEDAP
jgi:hypothetical protein